jgi:hypothetical protein
VQFEVWPENWLTVQAFIAMATQWRWTGGMEPRRCGLDYGALPMVYEGLEIRRKDRPTVFQGLRMMEVEALDVMLRA